MLKFCVLSSGSRANCIYVSDGTSHTLIDCGLSCRETQRRLRTIGIEAHWISSIIISHEHSDHTCGAGMFATKYKAEIHTNLPNLDLSRGGTFPDLTYQRFSSGEPFQVGAMQFEPFSVSHDAEDPVGFRITAGGCALAIITDLGQLTTLVRERVRGLHGLIIESNHDPELLNECPYPWPLKQRIRGNSGHLSNQAAAELVEELSFRNEKQIQVIVAAHISEKSNVPELAVEGLRRAWQRGMAEAVPEFVAASAFFPTRCFQLSAAAAAAGEPEGVVHMLKDLDRLFGTEGG